MISIPVLAILFSFFSYQSDCKTTFKILDCSNNPVKHADVVIRKCKTQEILRQTTNENGEAAFDVCKSEICSTKIIVNKLPAEFSLGDNCNGTGKEVVCTMKLCN
jgi:hypothetical protein